MSKEILGTETYKFRDYQVALILNDNLNLLLNTINHDTKILQEGLSDRGTCCLGMGVEVLVCENKRSKPIKLRFIKQVWQGSSDNEVYFKRVLDYIQENYPELRPFCSINYGRMD